MSLTIVSPMSFLIKRTAKHIFQTPISLTLFVVLMSTVMWGYSVIDAADLDFFPSSSLAFLFTYYYNSHIASSVVKDSLPVADERITKWVNGQTFSFMFAWFLMLVIIDLVLVNRLQLDPNYVYVKNTGTQFLMLSFIFSFIKTANWFVFFDVFNDSRIANAAMLKMGMVMNSQDLGTHFIENQDNKKHIKQLVWMCLAGNLINTIIVFWLKPVSYDLLQFIIVLSICGIVNYFIIVLKTMMVLDALNGGKYQEQTEEQKEHLTQAVPNAV